MMYCNLSRTIAITAALMLTGAWTAGIHAAVVEEFDGNDTGWSANWVEGENNGGSFDSGSPQIVTTEPLGGDTDDYYEIKGSASSGNQSISVSRTFTAASSGLTLTDPITYTMLFRGDGLQETVANEARYSIADTADTTGNTGPGQTWALLASVANGWQAFDGDGSGGVTGVDVLDFSQDTVYSIEINVVPDATDPTWTATITNLDTNDSASTGSLAFRSSATTVAGRLLLNAFAKDVSDPMDFSVDAIEITQTQTAVIPTPTALPLGLALMGLALARRRC